MSDSNEGAPRPPESRSIPAHRGGRSGRNIRQPIPTSPVRQRPGAPVSRSSERESKEDAHTGQEAKSLGVTARTVSSKRTASQAQDLELLQQQSELYTKKIEMERRRSDELEKKLRISRKKLEESRQRLGGYDDVASARKKERLLKLAEYRLEHMHQRLSVQSAQNEEMKHEVESLRRDKMQRESIISKLERDLQQLKSQLEIESKILREEAESRDNAQREIQSLQASIQREVKAFEQEFESRIAAASSEATRPQRLERLDQKISQSESVALLLHLGSEEGHYGALTIEQERVLKHKSTKTLWDIAKREVEVKEQKSALAEYEEMFAKIQEGTGIRTIEEMVSAFTVAEDQSFSLVTMINEASQEIEEIDVEIAQLKEHISIANRDVSSSAQHQKSFNQAAEDQIRVLEAQAREADQKHEEALRLLDRIKPGVHSLFQKVGASDEAAMESLAATGVSDTNLLQFLGIVEDRVTEMVRMQQLLRIAPPPITVGAMAPGSLEEQKSQRPRASKILEGDGEDLVIGGAMKMPQPPSVDQDEDDDAAVASDGADPAFLGRRGTQAHQRIGTATSRTRGPGNRGPTSPLPTSGGPVERPINVHALQEGLGLKARHPPAMA